MAKAERIRSPSISELRLFPVQHEQLSDTAVYILVTQASLLPSSLSSLGSILQKLPIWRKFLLIEGHCHRVVGRMLPAWVLCTGAIVAGVDVISARLWGSSLRYLRICGELTDARFSRRPRAEVMRFRL